jgi:DNA-directed RNA polymerase subunit RPC12/RpoP
MDTHTKVSACVDCGNAFHAASVLSKRCPPCQRLYVNAQTSIRDKNRRERRKGARMARAALGVSYEPLRDNGHRCRSCRRVLFLDCGRAQHHCHQCRDGLAVVDVLMQVVSLIVDVVTEHGPACHKCGGWVLPWNTVTCSDECYKERQRQRARDRYEAATGVRLKPASGPRPCRLCDRTITPDHAMGRGRDVCDYCNMHRKRGFKGRAMAYGVPYTHVHRKAVYARDGWRCQLCGHKVLKKAKRNKHTRRLHPRTASLDHIIPMSKGGPHCEANVQCACLRCNVRKQARLIGQTRLF